MKEEKSPGTGMEEETHQWASRKKQEAPWCGYCRRIGPAVDALAAEYAGKVAVGKVNVDEQPELAEQFKVMTIPSLFVFQNGEHGEAIIAPGSKAQIEEFMRAQGAL